jgi:hypothetical protein
VLDLHYRFSQSGLWTEVTCALVPQCKTIPLVWLSHWFVTMPPAKLSA